MADFGEREVPILQPMLIEMLRAVFLENLHRLVRIGLIDGNISKGDRTILKGEIIKAGAIRRDIVILPLLGCTRDDLNLLLVEAEARILLLDGFFKGLVVRQENLAGTGFKDRREDWAVYDITQRLRCKDDGGIVFAELFEPHADFLGKLFVVEEDPALIQDGDGRPAFEFLLGGGRCT